MKVTTDQLLLVALITWNVLKVALEMLMECLIQESTARKQNALYVMDLSVEFLRISTSSRQVKKCLS
ncbi:MAG: hypothetical protein EBT96_10750 [Betaproteobacteria bacterium]|nr:hypothetical protein [Betaproteobacteria bacterium]